MKGFKMASPIENIEKGIKTQNWKCIAEAYTGLTGKGISVGAISSEYKALKYFLSQVLELTWAREHLVIEALRGFIAGMPVSERKDIIQKISVDLLGGEDDDINLDSKDITEEKIVDKPKRKPRRKAKSSKTKTETGNNDIPDIAVEETARKDVLRKDGKMRFISQGSPSQEEVEENEKIARKSAKLQNTMGNRGEYKIGKCVTCGEDTDSMASIGGKSKYICNECLLKRKHVQLKTDEDDEGEG